MSNTSTEDKASQKWEILGAFYKYGSNYDAIKTALPHIDLIQIKFVINGFRKRAKKRITDSRSLNKCSDEPLDLWHDLANNCHNIEGTTNYRQLLGSRKRKKKDLDPPNDFSFILSKSMMYAASFENHYQSSNPDEPNYNEIYKYLGQILAGDEPTQLRPGNAAKILEMLKRMKNVVSDKTNIKNYISNMPDHVRVSYLKIGSNPLETASQKRKTMPENFTSESKKWKESLSNCTKTDEELVNIEPSDSSRFRYKREISVEKLAQKQRSIASVLANIPGLNPFEISPDCLVKPPRMIIPPKNQTKSDDV